MKHTNDCSSYTMTCTGSSQKNTQVIVQRGARDTEGGLVPPTIAHTGHGSPGDGRRRRPIGGAGAGAMGGTKAIGDVPEGGGYGCIRMEGRGTGDPSFDPSLVFTTASELKKKSHNPPPPSSLCPAPFL